MNRPLVIDVHVHTCAFRAGEGVTSDRLVRSGAFRWMRWGLGLGPLGTPAENQVKVESALYRAVGQTPELDRAVVLAFDAVHTETGVVDPSRTHLYVTNDAARRVASGSSKLWWACSVHPYRRDAVAELERCKRLGAVACKWLPITQGFSPADRPCLALYEAMAGLNMPLLCHTGGERSLPQLRPDTADPRLLEGALRAGVTVIMAHCASRSVPGERDFYPEFARLAKTHERCFGDTSALCLPTRWYALRQALDDEGVRDKLVHGSDWPIVALPDPGLVGMEGATEAMAEGNWIRRDVRIKRRLGLGAEYWERAWRVLGGERRMD